MEPRQALASLWTTCGGDGAALDRLTLTGSEPVLPSSFPVGTAAQVSIAAQALAAAELWRLRTGQTQQVSVDMRHAAANVIYASTAGPCPIFGTRSPEPIAAATAAGFGFTRTSRIIVTGC
jgi:hypothetical protein